jgi:splicing factor 3B subunit 1
MTPTPGSKLLMQSLPYWQKDIYDRNKPWTDDELDALIPSQGYELVPAPQGYVPIMTPSRKLAETPVMIQQTPQGYMIPDGTGKPYDV